MLKDRVITAILLLAGLLGAVFLLPAAGWMVLCAALCAAAAWEWGGLARFERPLRMLSSIVFGVTCLMVGFLAGLGDGSLSGAMLLIPTALAMMHLRTIGPWVLLGTMAVVWVADIAAYFSGRAFGRHKLAPSISPGKTWEGALGGALGVLLFGFGILVAFGARQPGGAFVIALALLAWTAISVIGDLFESLLKRQAGLKDSGSILPGHGGILDRIDSLTSTLPIVALASVWLAA